MAVPASRRDPVHGGRMNISLFLEGDGHRPVSSSSHLSLGSIPGSAFILVSRPSTPMPTYDSTVPFTLYIDGARFLPANCTATKVVGRIFDAKATKGLGDINTTSQDFTSPSHNPIYGWKMEFTERNLTPTATMIVKV